MLEIKSCLSRIACSLLFTLSVGAQAKEPNVLFIMVDDLGWMDTSCYGSQFFETPNVDRLARSGMRFTDAYAADPLCSPTRSSILTGQYPARTGFIAASGHVPGLKEYSESHTERTFVRAASPNSFNYLPLEYYTLGEAFKDAGYQTAFLGKWHLGHPPYVPEAQGFDFVVGGREHPGPPGLAPERKFFPPWDKIKTLPENPPSSLHIDDYLAEQAVAYINESKDKPFFMCFWLYNVHAPFQCKPELIEKWKSRVDPNNPQQSPTMAAMIDLMDQNVGTLLDALEENGIAEDTIVIFTSDNGGNMYDVTDGTTPTNNYPLRSGKGNSYEGGVRVPFIVRWPGVTKPGSVNDSVITSVDHFPALLEMTGQALRPDDHKDGLSYAPALRGEPFDRGPIICGFKTFIPATMNFPNTSMRMGDYKMYRFWFDSPELEHRYELYDLKRDIGETNNLALEMPEKLQEIIDVMDAFYAESKALKPNLNQDYHGNSLGVWYGSSKGVLSEKNGVMQIHADNDQVFAQTDATPSIVDGAKMIFKARSKQGSDVSFEWTSSAQREFTEPQVQRIQLAPDWKTYEIEMPFSGRISALRLALSKVGSEAEFRELGLYTKEGTLMRDYERF